MVTINLTLLLQFGLFISFLWLADRFVYRPLLRAMDDRADRVTGDTAAAEKDTAEAQSAHDRFIAQITDAHQEAARRLRQERLNAYTHNRQELEKTRVTAEKALLAYREEVQRQLDDVRGRYGEYAPSLVTAIDGQLKEKGHLL